MQTNDNLILEFEASQFYPNPGHGVKAVSAENHISFLWFAGNKSSLRDVASRFGVGESTIHRNCDRVMNFLVHIAPTVIKFPRTQEEKVKAAKDFLEVSGRHHVVSLGCIDGTFIPIRTPAKKIKSTYVNRHDLPSITLQGICSAKKEFVDVFVGPPSKLHDSRIFQLSFLSSELPALCESEWHLLGDAAYPLREWLLTPYRDYGNLTEAEKVFNRTHSGCRVTIENTFGILKQRFRQLMRVDVWTVDRATKLVLSCCVLHNLCIRGNDLWN
ncbi:putative nuclease HARBI1 [Bacillus rossius redtenbacheri]|uniref:putative nuclease HARBI1 n=1 Tax=Bacillus rossius redtenbacheri TaxID=93214 RepID=UPI002FDCC45B